MVFTASLVDFAWAADKNVNVVFIPKSRDQDFWVFMRDGVDRAIREERNIDLTWRGPAYNDHVDAQIQILQKYTVPAVDAIVLAPTDRARLMEPVRQAVAMGIKVVVVDSVLDGSDFSRFIGTDNYAAGKLAAAHMAGLLRGQGEVLILRTVAGSASTDQRASGFIDYLKKNAPKIRIVADEYGGGSRGKALHAAADLLNKNPRVDGIFAVNESVSDGMLRALRQAGLAGKKKFVGFDSTSFLLAGLEQHEIDGLIVQNPRQMGYLGLKAALGAVKNAPVESRTVFVDAVMVTLENYRKAEIQALLKP
ncbi:substrate-binding domain-containing protein [Oxalobacteraceae bacterium]|nr:substrate-binding domain-containing protein [Oxalobacteraceae bacterium]